MASSTYSFLDVNLSMSGPGFAIVSLGSESGVAKEGVTVSMVEDKNTMTMGADGGGMHSLHGGNAGTIALRLLKTNPNNAILNRVYTYQKQSSAYWGQNTITISNFTRGDAVVAVKCAFRRQPDFINAEDGGTVEWTFDSIKITEVLGDGSPNIAI